MRKVKLGDIADTALGKMLDAKKNKGELHPYLANIHVRWGEFDLDDLPLMKFEDSEKERYSLRDGDLIMCEGGEPGRCAIWREQLPDVRYQKALHRIRPHEGVDVRWLYYWFVLQGRIGGLNQYFVETTIKHLVGEDVRAVEIDLPSHAEQVAIADVLSSIDDKIASNKKLVSELEQTAQLIYDYWFTQFDFPDENGNPYRSSGGKMVWNDQLKREIPEGWTATNLYGIADYINGLACQNYRPNTTDQGLPVVKIREMREGISKNTERVASNIPGSNIIDDGDLLFAWSASLEVQFWNGGRAGLNQHIFKVIPKSEVPTEYVYQQLVRCLVTFRKMAEVRKTTMGHITSDHLSQSKIVLPAREVLKEFDCAIRQLRQCITQLGKQTQTLASLRDWLLPMLMNGQVTVTDKD